MRASMLLLHTVEVIVMLLHQLLLMYSMTPPPLVLLHSSVRSDLIVVNCGIPIALVGILGCNHVSVSPIQQDCLYWCRNLQFTRSSSILLCMLLQFPNITDGTNGLFLRRLTLFLTPPRLPLFLGFVVVVALLLRAGSRSDGRLGQGQG